MPRTRFCSIRDTSAVRGRARRRTARRSPPSRLTSAAAMATSVPVPIAIPTSASARAGASFKPSPDEGNAPALAPQARRPRPPCPPASPRRAPLRSRHAKRSLRPSLAGRPVTIATRRPIARSRSTAPAAPGFTASSTATSPATSPSSRTRERRETLARQTRRLRFHWTGRRVGPVPRTRFVDPSRPRRPTPA